MAGAMDDALEELQREKKVNKTRYHDRHGSIYFIWALVFVYICLHPGLPRAYHIWIYIIDSQYGGLRREKER